VAEPVLYREYLPWKAIAEFAGGGARSVCGGQWVIGRGRVLGFIEVGVPPRLSCFHSPDVFRWAAWRQGRAAVSLAQHFGPSEMPEELFVGRGRDLPIFLFVRAHGEEQYTFVGRLAPGQHRDSVLGRYPFALTPPLPMRLWAGLRPPRGDGSAQAALDAALARLPDSPPAEWRHVVCLLLKYLHGPLGPGDALTESEIQAGSDGLLDPRDIAFLGRGYLVERAEQRLAALVPPIPRGLTGPVRRLYAGHGVFATVRDLSGMPPLIEAFAPTEGPLSRLACILDRAWAHFDWRPVFDPEWLAWSGGSVRHMARVIRDDNRLADLPILADALADAGCDDDTLLGHLREPGIHHQGCRVLDAILEG
jgi:hypothetical protein